MFILLGNSDLKAKLKTLKHTALALGSACTEHPAGSGLLFESDRKRVTSSRTFTSKQKVYLPKLIFKKFLSVNSFTSFNLFSL